jgi:hypothetical protein
VVALSAVDNVAGMTETPAPVGVDINATGPAPHELAQSRQLFQHAVSSGADYARTNQEWLQSGGTTPLDMPTPSTKAQAEIAALGKDKAFVAKVQQGDPDAVAKLHQLAAAGDEQAVVDQQMPPARAEDFVVPPLAEYGQQPTAEALAGAATMRTALATAGIDRQTGNAILSEAHRTSSTYTAMSEDQRVAYASSEKAKLMKLPGWGDATDAKLKLGNQLLAELEVKSPGVLALAHRSGLTASAIGISMIVQYAERLAARRK